MTRRRFPSRHLLSCSFFRVTFVRRNGRRLHVKTTRRSFIRIRLRRGRKRENLKTRTDRRYDGATGVITIRKLFRRRVSCGSCTVLILDLCAFVLRDIGSRQGAVSCSVRLSKTDTECRRRMLGQLILRTFPVCVFYPTFLLSVLDGCGLKAIEPPTTPNRNDPLTHVRPGTTLCSVIMDSTHKASA